MPNYEGAEPRDNWQKHGERPSVLDFSIDQTIGDGGLHPLSDYYSTLAEAQARYPHAVSLDDQLAWCAIQKGVNSLAAGQTLDGVRGTYRTNRSITLPSNVRIEHLKLKLTALNSDQSGFVINGESVAKENIHFLDVDVDGNRQESTDMTAPDGNVDGYRFGFSITGQVSNVTLTNCSANYCATDGLFLFGKGSSSDAPTSLPLQSISIRDCEFRYNRRHGCTYVGAHDLSFDSCIATDNGLTINGQTDILHGEYGANLSGALYGTGWWNEDDLNAPGYGLSNVRFVNCISRDNYTRSYMFVTYTIPGTSGVLPRSDIMFTNCYGDSGRYPLADADFAVHFDIPSANQGTGAMWKNVSFSNCTFRGSFKFIQCSGIYFQGGEISTTLAHAGFGAYSTDIHVMGTRLNGKQFVFQYDPTGGSTQASNYAVTHEEDGSAHVTGKFAAGATTKTAQINAWADEGEPSALFSDGVNSTMTIEHPLPNVVALKDGGGAIIIAQNASSGNVAVGSSSTSQGRFTAWAPGGGTSLVGSDGENSTFKVAHPSPNRTVFIDGAGNVWLSQQGLLIALGEFSPTARLHLPAGSTAASSAPLKLTAGSLMSSPETGAVEFDGSNLWVTYVTGRSKLGLPDQTDKDGQTLHTDGTSAYWGKVVLSNQKQVDVSAFADGGIIIRFGNALAAVPLSGSGFLRIAAGTVYGADKVALDNTDYVTSSLNQGRVVVAATGGGLADITNSSLSAQLEPTIASELLADAGFLSALIDSIKSSILTYVLANLDYADIAAGVKAYLAHTHDYSDIQPPEGSPFASASSTTGGASW